MAGASPCLLCQPGSERKTEFHYVWEASRNGVGDSQQGSVTTLRPLPVVHWGGEDFPIILQTKSVVACYGEEENYSDK